MSIYNMSRKFKKLTLQYAYLQLEAEEVNDICTNVEAEIREYIKQHYPEHYDGFFKSLPDNPGSNKVTENDQIEEEIPDLEDIEHEIKKKESKNKDLKKLYRKIAEKTHPDKIGDNSLSQIFSDAARAYTDNDIAKMLEIAGQLNIEITGLGAESIALLNQNIHTLASEIHSKRNTAAWSWHSAGQNMEEKKRIIEFILKNRGIKL
jgi:hypothetical protein